MLWTFSSDRPIYSQLIDKIEFLILSGNYKLGEKLPSVRDFADIASVNPNTMQKALSELERKGLVITQRTSGKFITNDSNLINDLKVQKAKKLCFSFFNEMNKIGYDKENTINFLNNFKKGD